jgi:hypothetical protein
MAPANITCRGGHSEESNYRCPAGYQQGQCLDTREAILRKDGETPDSVRDVSFELTHVVVVVVVVQLLLLVLLLVVLLLVLLLVQLLVQLLVVLVLVAAGGGWRLIP